MTHPLVTGRSRGARRGGGRIRRYAAVRAASTRLSIVAGTTRGARRIPEQNVTDLTRGGLYRTIVTRGEPEGERSPAPEFTLHGDRAVKLFDDAFGDGQA